ncbi:hypothetical protein NE237_008122 [Protea cynaroides]|uniref:Uncharacterized protein n=1 Tax=Protea cynaroides TaxID=273540 RepID=A0A9Q0KQH1_9MAGN|nr:hypothetical protein NE237_008122 [Protea cynaroides]
MNALLYLSKHRQQISKNLEKLEASDQIRKEAYRVRQELAEKNESLKEQLDSTKVNLSAAEKGKSNAELEVSRLQSELRLEKKKATAELNLLKIDHNREKESLEARLQKYVLDSPSKRLLRTKIGGNAFLKGTYKLFRFVCKVAPELDLDGYDLKLDDVPSSSLLEGDSEIDLEEGGSEAEP